MLHAQKPLARRFGLARLERRETAVAIFLAVVEQPMSIEPKNDTIEPPWSSYAREPYEPFPTWPD